MLRTKNQTEVVKVRVRGATYFYGKRSSCYPADNVVEEAHKAKIKADAFYWDDLHFPMFSPKSPKVMKTILPLRSKFFTDYFDLTATGMVRADILENLYKANLIKSKGDVLGALRYIHANSPESIRYLPNTGRINLARKEINPNLTLLKEVSPLKISVIISFKDRPELTIRCLESIRLQKLGPNKVEIILIDNQSEVQTMTRLRSYLDKRFPSDLKYKILDYPYSYNHSKQSNLGVRHSTGNVIVMMNNDVVLLSKTCLIDISKVAIKTGVASVSPVIVGKGGRVVCSGVHVFFDKNRKDYGIRENEICEFREFLQESVASPFCCAAISRVAWQKVGGLDEIRYPAQYNDADFGLKAIALGMRHFTFGGIYVYHEPGRSEVRSIDQSIGRHASFCEAHPDLDKLYRIQCDRQKVKALIPISTKLKAMLIIKFIGETFNRRMISVKRFIFVNPFNSHFLRLPLKMWRKAFL